VRGARAASLHEECQHDASNTGPNERVDEHSHKVAVVDLTHSNGVAGEVPRTEEYKFKSSFHRYSPAPNSTRFRAAGCSTRLLNKRRCSLSQRKLLTIIRDEPVHRRPSSCRVTGPLFLATGEDLAENARSNDGHAARGLGDDLGGNAAEVPAQGR
jgi:hypothetical protein